MHGVYRDWQTFSLQKSGPGRYGLPLENKYVPGRFEGQLGLDRIPWMIMIYNACDVIFVCIKSFFFKAL